MNVKYFYTLNRGSVISYVYTLNRESVISYVQLLFNSLFNRYCKSVVVQGN